MEKNKKLFVLHRIKLRVPMDAQVWSFFVVLPSTLGSRSWPIPQFRVMHHLAVYIACLMRQKKTWIPLFLLVKSLCFTVKSSEIHPPLAPTGLGIGRIVMPKAMQMRATHHEIGLTNLSPGRAEPCPFGWCKKWEKCGRESGQTHGFSQ